MIFGALGLLGVLAGYVVGFLFFSTLPDEIPIHWSGGEANGWGGPAHMFIYPSIGLGLWALLVGISRATYAANLPESMNTTRASQLMVTTGAVLSWSMAGLTWFAGRSAVTGEAGLPIVLLIVLFGGLITALDRLPLALGAGSQAAGGVGGYVGRQLRNYEQTLRGRRPFGESPPARTVSMTI